MEFTFDTPLIHASQLPSVVAEQERMRGKMNTNKRANSGTKDAAAWFRKATAEAFPGLNYYDLALYLVNQKEADIDRYLADNNLSARGTIKDKVRRVVMNRAKKRKGQVYPTGEEYAYSPKNRLSKGFAAILDPETEQAEGNRWLDDLTLAAIACLGEKENGFDLSDLGQIWSAGKQAFGKGTGGPGGIEGFLQNLGINSASVDVNATTNTGGFQFGIDPKTGKIYNIAAEGDSVLFESKNNTYTRVAWWVGGTVLVMLIAFLMYRLFKSK
jgi:hypothetical protein